MRVLFLDISVAGLGVAPLPTTGEKSRAGDKELIKVNDEGGHSRHNANGGEMSIVMDRFVSMKLAPQSAAHWTQAGVLPLCVVMV